MHNIQIYISIVRSQDVNINVAVGHFSRMWFHCYKPRTESRLHHDAGRRSAPDLHCIHVQTAILSKSEYRYQHHLQQPLCSNYYLTKTLDSVNTRVSYIFDTSFKSLFTYALASGICYSCKKGLPL